MKVMNQNIEQKQEQTFVIEWTPKDRMTRANYVVSQKIVGVEMDIDIGGNKITYDSTQKNAKNPMTDFFDQLKQELTFTHQPRPEGEIDVRGPRRIHQGPERHQPADEAAAQGDPERGSPQEDGRADLVGLPQAGKEQKSWTDLKATLDLGPIGTYKTKFDFTAGRPG